MMAGRPRQTTLRVLISGGASGIGLACAEAFAEHGAELLLCDADGAALRLASARLQAWSRVCDAIDEASVTRMAADVAAAFPSIDVLINVAGRGYVRTLGMTRTTRALLPMLRASGGGARFVFNLPALGGFACRDGIFPYASSLEAFDRLHESLRELISGTSIELAKIAPLERVRGRCSRVLAAPIYRLQRIDEQGTAQAIVRRVAVARPDWAHCAAQPSRRANRF